MCTHRAFAGTKTLALSLDNTWPAEWITRHIGIVHVDTSLVDTVVVLFKLLLLTRGAMSTSHHSPGRRPPLIR